MLTTKSYTDLEQSKKLAEILRSESADMYYHNRSDIPDSFPLPIEWKHNNPLLSQEITCWSLAALLDILSKTAHSIDEDGSVSLDSYKNIEWSLCLTNTNVGLVTANNPVDACYEMILKLNELNLL